MKVIATKPGYYDHKRRYPKGHGHKMSGQPFVLSDPAHFSEHWMEKVDDGGGKKGRGRKPEPEAEEFSEDVI